MRKRKTLLAQDVEGEGGTGEVARGEVGGAGGVADWTQQTGSGLEEKGWEDKISVEEKRRAFVREEKKKIEHVL